MFDRQFKSEIQNWDGKRFLEQLSDTKLRAINTNILIFIFWKLLEALSEIPGDVLVVSELFGSIYQIF